MKHILLNIRDSAKKQTNIFIIMLVCVCSTALILNFSYGLYINATTEKIEMDNDLKQIASEINPQFAPTRLQIQNFVEALPENICSNLNFYFSGEVPEYADSGLFSELESRFVYRNNQYALMPKFRMNLENSLISGRVFTDKEENEAVNVAMVYNDGVGWDTVSSNSGNGKSYITLLGKKYTVIGEFGGAPNLPIVPFLSIPDDYHYNKVAIIIFDHFMSRTQYAILKETANIYMPNAITFPDLPLPDSDDMAFLQNMISLSVLISFLSILNFAMLYRYVLEKRKRSLAIYRICGCTKAKAVSIYLCECMIVSIPSFIFGTALYIILLHNVLEKIFPFIQQADKAYIYLTVFSIYFSVMLLMMGVMIKSHIQSEIVQEWRRHN